MAESPNIKLHLADDVNMKFLTWRELENGSRDDSNMMIIDRKIGELESSAGDMQTSVYDPQGRGEDVFAGLDGKLDKTGGDVDGLLSCGSVLEEDLTKALGLNVANRDVVIDASISGGLGILAVTREEDGGGFQFVVRGDGTYDSVVPMPEAPKNVANKGYVDAQIQTRAAAAHSHTAEEVGALPADVSDMIDINTISGPEDSVMIDMSAGLVISLDGADRIVVEKTETYMGSTLRMMDNRIEDVRSPSAATDAANKGYVDSKIATRAAASHVHTAGDVSFADGETFQAKLDAGKLTGPAGAKGTTGAQGPKGATGATGADGKTPMLSINASGHLIATYE